MRHRLIATPIFFVATALISVGAYLCYPRYFMASGWVGTVFLYLGALFFSDLMRGGTIGVGYWRLPPNPSRVVLAWACLLATAVVILGLAALFRPAF